MSILKDDIIGVGGFGDYNEHLLRNSFLKNNWNKKHFFFKIVTKENKFILVKLLALCNV